MHIGEKPKAHSHNPESGNIFFTLFGAVVIVGLLGTIIMSTMRGPLTTMVEVQTRTKAEIEMDIASKLVLLEATQLPDDGDCDADGFVEPLEYLDAGGAGPAGGGFLPTAVSSSRIDPWGIEFGYCGWDAGAVTGSIGCDINSNGTSERLNGNGDPGDETYTVIAVISAGPDQIFQTTCSGGASPSITKGGDDIVSQFSYGAAIAATNGLWNIKSGDPSIAEIDKNLEVTGGAAFTGGIDLTASSAALRLGAASMLFPDQTTLSTCNAANNGLVRVNTTPNPDVLELCDSVNGWVSISNGFWSGGSGNDIYYNTGTPQVGIGTTTPGSTLEVSGDVSISDVLNVANGFNLTGGDAAIANNMTVTGTVGVTGQTSLGLLQASGDVVFDSALSVDGQVIFENDLDLRDSMANSDGDVTIDDALHVTSGDVTIDDNLIVVGSSDLQNTIINTTGDVTLDDTAVITGTLDAQGAISDSTGNLTLSDDVDISGDLDVTGDIDGTNLSASVAVNAGTTINVNGDILGPPLSCTSVQKLEWNAGSGWSCVTDLQGGSGGGIPALDDVSDVAAPTPANGDCIVYNNVSGNWESAACAGIAAGVFEIVSNVARVKSSAGSYANDDLVFGSDQLAEDTGNADDDARLFFDKSKAAFRVGDSENTTVWNDANVGTNSIAIGSQLTASGSYSTALGREAIAANTDTLAIGLGTAAGADPQVSGTSSIGIFMGDQSGANVSSANTMAILGGAVTIGSTAASTSGSQPLELDVTGDIGANNYCDADGNNCFTAAGVSGGIWTDNTTYISRQNLSVINTGQTSTTANLDDDGTRALYDPNKAALRGGTISGGNTAWQDINIGNNSIGWGQNTLASGPGSVALGYEVSATGDYAIALGGSGTSAVANNAIAIGSNLGAASTGSIAIGHGNVISGGTNAMAIGTNARTSGDYSASIGLGAAAGTFPIVSGANSLGIFMGDQSGYDLSDSNFMALVGGDFLIDDDGTAGSQGCIRYTEGTGLEYSNDCAGFTPFTSLGNLWTDNTTYISRTGNVMVDGTFATSPVFTPAGAGTRMFFYPRKSAFRAGTVNGTEWDDGNIGNYSIAMGSQATASNTSAFAVGFQPTASGDGSIALGFQSIASGDNSVAIGQKTTVSGEDSMAIGLGFPSGASPAVSGNNSLGIFMGDHTGENLSQANTMAVLGGNMGIGTLAPSSLLHLQDGDMMLGDTADTERNILIERNGTTIGQIGTANSDLTIQALNSEVIRIVPDGGITDGGIVILDNGDVGIGTAGPVAELDISGTGALITPRGTEAQRPTAVDGMIRYKTDVGSSAIGFEVREAGAWVAMGASVSDKRLKENIQPLSGQDILNRLQDIKTYRYTMKNDQTHRLQYGVIAQELMDTFPELVNGTPDDEDNMMSVKYVGLIAPMIEATKELKKENNQLRAELDALKEQVQTLNRHALSKTDKASMMPYLLIMFAMLSCVVAHGLFRRAS
jgi:cytoskeletal protein CcmA (bactofilin family)